MSKTEKTDVKLAAADARVTPVSGGDAVVEPFWDEHLGAWKHWSVEAAGIGVSAGQCWHLVTVEWTAAAAGEGPILRRRYAGDGLDMGPYTHLVLSAGFSKGTRIVLRAVTDAGRFEEEFVCGVSHTDQHVLPLPGAKRLRQVEIRPGAAAAGPVRGNQVWLGLRHPGQAALEAEQWRLFSSQPLDVYLQDPDPAEAAPLYNLLAPPAAFKEQQEAMRAAGAASLGLKSEVTLVRHLGDDQGRSRIWATFSTATGESLDLLAAAQLAALAGDRDSLREVAKAAVQLCLIPHWDSDFSTAFPGSAWEHRPFQQVVTCYAVAIALDLAGAWLTRAGRDLIRRRLAEDGLGNINFCVWRHPYIFDCNQLSAFSMGRLAVYALLEKQGHWGHVPPYTDLSFAELNESLGRIFAADGGFPEGTGYMAYTLDTALPALAIYGNARGKLLRDLLPPLLAKIDDYLEVFRSTERPRSLILNSDGQSGFGVDMSPAVLAVLAKIRPGGAAARMLAAIPKEQRDHLALWALPTPDLAGTDPNRYEPFVRLPVSGIAASARKLDGEWVKLVICGGPANAGHNHEDRGSFVLEFAGETFAADPGGIDYSDVASAPMKHAQTHNMLAPVAEPGAARPRAANPAPFAVIPEAAGDATSFAAEFSPGVLWPDHYQTWTRRFASPSPAELIIIDEYERVKGAGVEFLWHTPLPVFREDGRIVVKGARGRAVITPPAGAAIEIVPPRDLGCRQLSTIVFRTVAGHGTLVTKVRLEK